MDSRVERSDEDLRELNGHVLWHVRQFCRLARPVADGRDRGETVALQPLDAAALEGMLVHARALTWFLWDSRSTKPAPRKTDGLAEDYFDEGAWRPVARPQRLRKLVDRAGRDLVHVSYNRLTPQEAWGWDLDSLGVDISHGMIDFSRKAPSKRLANGFASVVRWEFIEVLRVDPIGASMGARALGHSVGAPMMAWWLPRVGPDADRSPERGAIGSRDPGSVRQRQVRPRMSSMALAAW
jgi:hypothetical protein